MSAISNFAQALYVPLKSSVCNVEPGSISAIKIALSDVMPQSSLSITRFTSLMPNVLCKDNIERFITRTLFVNISTSVISKSLSLACELEIRVELS